MQPQTQFLELLIDTVNDLGLFETVTTGQLPSDGGITVEINAGYLETQYLNRQGRHVLPLLFLCKHKNQSIAFDTLCRIVNYFQRLRTYPAGVCFAWETMEVANEPTYVTYENNGQYIYSCIINATIYF